MPTNPETDDDVTRASRLGTVLVSMLAVRPEQVSRALELQRATGSNIGEALVELGAASPAEVDVAVALQARMRSGDVVGAADDVLRRAYEQATTSIVDMIAGVTR